MVKVIISCRDTDKRELFKQGPLPNLVVYSPLLINTVVCHQPETFIRLVRQPALDRLHATIQEL